jgi:hypothetical protein
LVGRDDEKRRVTLAQLPALILAIVGAFVIVATGVYGITSAPTLPEMNKKQEVLQNELWLHKEELAKTKEQLQKLISETSKDE